VRHKVLGDAVVRVVEQDSHILARSSVAAER
jgi:hypothetical protein